MQSASDKANTSNSDDGHEAGGKPNSSGTASNENSANSQQMANRTSPSDPNGQNPGLMDRMKDAVSSLFAKMNESPPSQSSQTPARNAAAPDQEQKGGKSDQGQSQSSSSQNCKPRPMLNLRAMSVGRPARSLSRHKVRVRRHPTIRAVINQNRVSVGKTDRRT